MGLRSLILRPGRGLMLRRLAALYAAVLLGLTVLIAILPRNKPIGGVLLFLCFAFVGCAVGLVIILVTASAVILQRGIAGRLHDLATRLKIPPRPRAALDPGPDPMWDRWVDG